MFKKIAFFIVTSIVIYFVMAVGLLVSQWPRTLPEREGLDFSGTMANTFKAPDDPAFAYRSYMASDGQALPYTHVAATGAVDKPLIIMLHGSSWHGRQFDGLAWNLRDVAEVKALTLRGHGEAPKRRGDIDYMGQFEDDIAELIKDEPEARHIVLLGHSSGGGLAVRFAGGKHRGLIDSALLLAPFLKHDAPTTRPNSGGWAHTLLRRMIGLSMLNNVGIRAFDGMTVIQFNMPSAVLEGPQGKFATTAYSWRLNRSYAPRGDYLSDVSRLPVFTLIAGTEDEAFVADGYEPLMSDVTDKGRYALVDGVGHLDIVDAAQTEARIREHLLEHAGRE